MLEIKAVDEVFGRWESGVTFWDNWENDPTYFGIWEIDFFKMEAGSTIFH